MDMIQSAPRSTLFDNVLFILAFTVLFLFGLRTISDADFWMHLAAGRQAVEQGASSVDPFSFGLEESAPWRQTSWLYDVMVYRLWQAGGAPLTLIVHSLLIAGAFFLVALTLRRSASGLLIAASLLLCMWILAPVFVPQARTVSVFFAGLFIYVLSRDRLTLWAGLLLVGAQILWTNMHVLFVLGPVIVAFAAVERIIASRRDKTGSVFSPGHLALLVATLLATLANPFGAGVWSEVAQRLTLHKQALFLDWISPFYHEFLPLPVSWLSIITLALVAITFVLRRERLPLMITACAVVSAFLLVRSSRVPDVAAILVFGFIVLGFDTVGSLVARGSSRGRGMAQGIVAILLLASVFAVVTNRYYIASGSAASFGLNANQEIFPGKALAVLSSQNALPERMINLAQDGGYILWKQPGKKVYTDSRGPLYGAPFYARLSAALIGQKDRDGEVLPLPDGTDAILLNATWAGARAAMIHLLAGEGEDAWGVAYFDGTSALMLRKNESNQAILANQELARTGLTAIQEDFARYRKGLGSSFIRPGNPSRLIGAAAMYQVLGRFDEAKALLDLVTEGSPRMAGAWMNRGIAELALRQTTQAVATLEHATKLIPDQPLAWLWLSRAYQVDGRTGDAEAMKEKARALNPAVVDRFEADTK